jgi:GrpB-like predicted nucleotidyltransferase (UPF0157 family)
MLNPMEDAFREPVALADPDPRWLETYALEARRIEKGLVELGPVIEHIGSTSVPLRAKPIIDIQITVAGSDVKGAVAALKDLGYDHHGQGGVPGREYLTRRPPAARWSNVHVFGLESTLPVDNRMIRDYLRAHPHAAREYEAVKQRTVDQGHTDLLSYSHAKDAHVAALREAAHAWTQRSRG